MSYIGKSFLSEIVYSRYYVQNIVEFNIFKIYIIQIIYIVYYFTFSVLSLITYLSYLSYFVLYSRHPASYLRISIMSVLGSNVNVTLKFWSSSEIHIYRQFDTAGTLFTGAGGTLCVHAAKVYRS